jgi:hypothetical protein
MDVFACKSPGVKFEGALELLWEKESCQTGLSILQARDRCDAHTEETRIPKINRTPQIATVADSHMMAERTEEILQDRFMKSIND